MPVLTWDAVNAAAAWYAAAVATLVAADTLLRQRATRRDQLNDRLKLATADSDGGTAYRVQILFEPPGQHTRYRATVRVRDGSKLFVPSQERDSYGHYVLAPDPQDTGGIGLGFPLGDERRGTRIVSTFYLRPDHPWRRPEVNVAIHDEATGALVVKRRFKLAA